MLELVHAGNPTPAAEQVAARAGVGLRTVFRHFKDMDSLYGEMSLPIEAELRGVIDQPFRTADWRERVIELVHRRVAAYERVAPYKRASDINRHRSPFLQNQNLQFVALARELLKQQLPPEVARDKPRLEALDMLLSFEVWSRLRSDQGLNPRRTAEVLERTARALLD